MLGIALAGLITNSITFVIIYGFTITQPSLLEARTRFCDKSTFDASALWIYTKMALSFILIVVLDTWVWEQMTLAAGLISTDDQAVQVIMISILMVCYMFGSGMQTVTGTLIGN
jgi:Na+-driven multidrug efflux pump